MHNADRPAPFDSRAVAVLVSGGLDSAILLGEIVRECAAVHPLYVRHGLYWEADELRHLGRFLDAIHRPALRPLQVLEMPVADLYGAHWSITGRNVPDADSPDAAVFLPGRNVLLLQGDVVVSSPRGAGRGAGLPGQQSLPGRDAGVL